MVHHQSPTHVYAVHRDNFTFASDGKQLMMPVTYCCLKIEMKSMQHFHAKGATLSCQNLFILF
jgi:hypothetical protein